MKIFLIIIGCIFLYIIGVFTTYVLSLYADRYMFGVSIYNDADEHFIVAFLWPGTIWILLVYYVWSKLKPKIKKYAIAITETLYQTNHKETEDED